MDGRIMTNQTGRISEATVQKEIIKYCGLALRKGVMYWSTPNETKPSNLGGLIAMGLKKGVLDLTFLYRDKPQHDGSIPLRMIFIEVKRPTTYKLGKRGKLIIDQKGGVLSDEQKAFGDELLSLGCPFYVVDNLPDFILIMKRHELTK